jgi:protein-L-isoaspartate(D-aspartate) O-methyltransferase
MSKRDEIRHHYSEELQAIANLQPQVIVRAFAKVPREHFLGPGPWQVRSPGAEDYWTTKDAGPKRLYHNVLVAINAERHPNNGLPEPMD